MAKRRRKLSAAQIRAGFGGKRRKTAARSKKRHTRAKHRKRTNPVRKRAVARHTRRAAPRRAAPKRRRAKTSHRQRTRKNPELVSFLLGNPAQKRRKGMARHKRKRAKARHNRSVGTRRRRVTHRRHSRRMNPGGIPLKDFAWGGAGVLGGFIGSAAIPQMFLGAGNTGVTGYAVTAAAGIGLTILTHMIFPRQRALTFGVGAGAAANLLRRVITDQTPFGGYLSNTGMGDYMVANWGPPIMTDGLNSAMAGAPGATAITSSGINMMDSSDVARGRPC